MFSSLSSLLRAFVNGDFNPAEYAFVVRGQEMYIVQDGVEVFRHDFGHETPEEICTFFEVEYEEV